LQPTIKGYCKANPWANSNPKEKESKETKEPRDAN